MGTEVDFGRNQKRSALSEKFSGLCLRGGWVGIVPRPEPATHPQGGLDATNRWQSPNARPNPKNPRKLPGSCICRYRVNRVGPYVS